MVEGLGKVYALKVTSDKYVSQGTKLFKLLTD